MHFRPAIQFPVYVNGKKLGASVHEELDHPVQTVLKVSFSDGFNDLFIIEDDGHVYGSGISAIPYARSLRFDLGHVVGIDPGKFYYNFSETIDGLPANVWVIEGENEAGRALFKVYYLDYFRFALGRVNDEWVITHQPTHGRRPDLGIARRTGHMLDSLLDESALQNSRKKV